VSAHVLTISLNSFLMSVMYVSLAVQRTRDLKL